MDGLFSSLGMMRCTDENRDERNAVCYGGLSSILGVGFLDGDCVCSFRESLGFRLGSSVSGNRRWIFGVGLSGNAGMGGSVGLLDCLIPVSCFLMRLE